jgi:hypothetical protein
VLRFPLLHLFRRVLRTGTGAKGIKQGQGGGLTLPN